MSFDRNFIRSIRWIVLMSLLAANVTMAQSPRAVRLPVTLEPDMRIDVHARVQGYVAQVHVDIGDRVKQGQLLVSIDAPELEAELDRRKQMLHQTEASLRVAQRLVEIAHAKLRQVEAARGEQMAMMELRTKQRDRYRELVAGGAVQPTMLDEAEYALRSVQATMAKIEADVDAAKVDIEAREAEVQLANAGVAVAKAQLQSATSQDRLRRIIAPFDGLVAARIIDPGHLVAPGQSGGHPLMVLEHVDVLRGVMTVPAEEASRVNVGDEVTFVNFGEESLTAPDGSEPRVSRMSQSLDRQTRTMRVEIDLANPYDEDSGRYQYLSGQYGTAEIKPQ